MLFIYLLLIGILMTFHYSFLTLFSYYSWSLYSKIWHLYTITSISSPPGSVCICLWTRSSLLQINSHYLNKYWLLINHTPGINLIGKIILKLTSFNWWNCTLNSSHVILPPFCLRGDELMCIYILKQDSLLATNSLPTADFTFLAWWRKSSWIIHKYGMPLDTYRCLGYRVSTK